MITVLIVEDQLDYQLYLKTIINSSSNLKCLGLVRMGADAIDLIKKLKPNIVLMDIGLPDMSGLECISILMPLCPEVKFMVCTIHDEDENVFEALKIGAKSYILKQSKPYQIIDAIEDLHNGNSPISGSIARKVLNYVAEMNSEKKGTEDYNMTASESKILQQLSKGYSYQEIADLLFVSKKTIKWHIYNIYKKLHASNRTEALNKYFKN